jgi:hypothetical protein
MVAHARCRQQHIADEQMAAEDCASIGGKGRAGNGDAALQALPHGVGHRSDIAARGRIEGRAIFEEELFGAGGFKPVEGVERLAHGANGL